MPATSETSPRRLWKVLLGPVAAGLVLWARPGDDFHIAAMAGIAVWMAAWWVTEAVAIPVTALLPLVLVPVCGIQPMREVAPNYGNPIIYLFLGGFLLAIALQESGVHRRIALGIVHKVGSQPRRLVLGFMLSSALLSMWISNTATVMVLMPIGLAVLAAVKDRGVERRALVKLGATIMLGIAYAADIGGMATLVGTPPNMVYKGQLGRIFPDAPPPSFGEWFVLGLPVSVVFLFVGWLLLTRVAFRLGGASLLGSREAVGQMRQELGPMRRDETVVVTVFVITALLWILRRPLEFGAFTIPGWSSIPWLKKGFLDDGVVAIAMALVLFLIPSRSRPGERLLEWHMAVQVPWGMLLLFGGGFALAGGFTSSGLSNWLGQQVTQLHGLPPLLVVAIVCTLLTFVTELTSNTATTTMVLPVLAAAGTAMNIDPRGLMIPATLSASCAFMMPVASPTQAIVFASGWVPIRDMVRAGIWFNVLGVALVTLVFALLAGPVMGIDLHVLPTWAAK